MTNTTDNTVYLYGLSIDGAGTAFDTITTDGERAQAFNEAGEAGASTARYFPICTLPEALAARKMREALQAFNLRMPPANAPCHEGLVPQSECGCCGRIKAGLEALRAAGGAE